MLVNAPEKVVLVLSAPKPGLRWEPELTASVPAPDKEPNESLSVTSQVAPALMMTGTESWMTPAPLMILPAAMMSGPVKLFAPVSVRLPVPTLVKPPAPPMTLAMVRLFATAGISMIALPPGNQIEWLLRAVMFAKEPVFGPV